MLSLSGRRLGARCCKLHGGSGFPSIDFCRVAQEVHAYCSVGSEYSEGLCTLVLETQWECRLACALERSLTFQLQEARVLQVSKHLDLHVAEGIKKLLV